MINEINKILLKEAKKAYKKGEVPVSALIIDKNSNKIIAKAHNLVETKKDCTMHAEIIAIKRASKKLKNWRLINCDMYVTLEPCEMCKKVINNSRIENVYYIVSKDKDEIKEKAKFKKIEKDNVSRETLEENFINLIKDFFKKIR